MKILYIGHYKDGTGWANAAKNNIIALDSVGVDVVPRAISYNEKDTEVNPRILELELKDTDGCDVCIQHVLPNNYCYNSGMKNIGYIATETSNFTDTGWQISMNLMDEIWVPSEYCKRACIESGVNAPIKIAPHSICLEDYSISTKGNTIAELYGSFNFVFVGEFIERKNLKALLRAFHTEFHPLEPVNLFIKTSQAPLETVQNYCSSVKKGLKLRQEYKEEVVICGNLPKEDYISVMDQCHCFVMPSRAEGFCIPALEAMSLGIPCLFPKGSAMEEFCIGEAVESKLEPCFGGVESLPNIYTANSEWLEVNVSDLQVAMRTQFMMHNTKESQKIKHMCVERAKNYDHKIIGNAFKELLN
jgi:glycosyltransferase involved in cell wall biosynthesis